MNSKSFLLLLALFLFSVLIRIPTLNRPLSKHHEFCTAVALRVMQIWDERGISTYDFNPVMTYPNVADKYINNYASGSGRMLDAEGNYYYVSHPPLAYYVPYFLFQLIGVRPDVLPIQIFNLLLHFLSALGIYFILKLLYRSLDRIAIAGFVFYLFSAATLWFQSNTYMSDMAVQPLFIYGILFALKFFESRKRKQLLLLVLFVFLMMYTTWLGVFFAATLMLFILVHWKHLESPVLVLAFIFGGASLAVAITALQYSHIAGFDAYYTEAFGRLSERSGLQNGAKNWFLLSGYILKNYVTSYLPLLIVFGLLSVLIKFRYGISMLALALALLPVLLLHLALPDYSGHDFVSLYGAVFLSIAAGVGSLYLIGKRKWILPGVLTGYVIISVGHYYYVNRPGEISQRGDRYAELMDTGLAIKQLVKPDEIVFLLNDKPEPEVIFYAGRNILQVENEEEAKAHLLRSPASEGIILKKLENNEIEAVSRIAE